jgi:hypothetical protein
MPSAMIDGRMTLRSPFARPRSIASSLIHSEASMRIDYAPLAINPLKGIVRYRPLVTGKV